MENRLRSTLGADIPLGQKTSYPNRYDSGLLCPVPRQKQREAMGFLDTTLFFGADLWNAYELSFQNLRGKPVRAWATFVVPCNSPFIAESKSVKLYLNSLNAEKFADISEIKEILERDLSKVCQDAVKVILFSQDLCGFFSFNKHQFYCLDELDVEINCYQREIKLLEIDYKKVVSDKVMTHLFKSHCLVTGQPDWGSIFIDYEGPQISRESLLAYLISFRDHVGFSENCIEQVYVDILHLAKPQKLMVAGRFTRRGGIDINPVRSNLPTMPINWRTVYQ